jgi:hypothetical protein
MSNLIPTTVVDKNGKTTTVHKKAEGASSDRASVAAPATSSAVAPALTGTMKAPSEPTSVSSLSDGDSVKMNYGTDYTEDLKGEYPDPEALAFEYIRDNGVTGEAVFNGARYSDDTNAYGERWESNRYDITLTNSDGNSITVPYSAGLGIADVPDINMVLSSLTSDAAMLANGDLPNEDEEGFDPMLEIKVREQTDELRSFVDNDDDYEHLLWG